MEPSKAETVGVSSNSRALCVALDRYRLPRAIVHVENRSFIAWNRAFLTLTEFSDNQICRLDAKDWVTLGNPVAEAPGLISCVVRTADTGRFLTGHAAVGDDGSVFLMPDLERCTSGSFEQGRVLGIQEERAKIKQIFHDAISPELLVVLFILGEVQKGLNANHAHEAAELAKVTRLIDNVIEKIVAYLDPQEAEQ
jgi:hypothetical protein